MNCQQPTTSERPARTAALNGVVVVVVALLGVDCAVTVPAAFERAPRAAVHAGIVMPAAAAVRACTPTVTWTIASLLILLLLGHQLAWIQPLVRLAGAMRLTTARAPISRLRRSHSISYHTGGLYGP